MVYSEYLSMVQVNYPYLDLTVLPELRPFIIAPNAAVLFDEKIENIFWTNGEGAGLIGAPTVRHALEGPVKLNPAMKRQIQSAVEQLAEDEDASAIMRVRRGFKTALIGFNVREFELPEGEKAILLATESLHGRGHSLEDMAQCAVDGLDGYTHASAIVDAHGAVVASSQHFEKLAVDDAELQSLVAEVATETDRLVKRPIKTEAGLLPAGIARLSDDPISHLLIIADAESEVVNTSTAVSTNIQPEDTETKNEAASVLSNDEEAAVETDAPRVGAFSNRRDPSAAQKLGRWYYKSQKSEPDATSTDNEATTENDDASSSEIATEDSNASYKTIAPSSALAGSGLVQEVDHTEIDDGPVTENADAPSNTVAPSASDAAAVDAEAKPVRFVWDMDADNRFRSASSEFATAVGEQSANVIGKTWDEVAEERGLDNGSEIAELLHKEDTWSGKTVLWPVDGTDLRVPIDLAGLPSYGRSQGFEGFNGFGIIRTADAVVDTNPITPEPTSKDFDESEGRKESEATTETDKVEVSEADNQQSADTDKGTVVDLNQRRETLSQRALSSDEQETFEEIGEKLGDQPITGDVARKKEVLPSAFARKPKTDKIAPAQNDDVFESPKENEDANTGSAGSVDTSILSRLPIPVLVYRDAELLFGNEEFFEVTGHTNLQALAKAGGIECLFGSNHNDEDTALVYHADGERLNYSANLQSVPWDDQRAMLLTLRNNGENGDGDGGARNRASNNADKDSHETSTDGASSQDNTPSQTAEPTANLASVVPFASKDKAIGQQQAFGGLEADDLRSILDTATDGVIILSDEGIIRAVNRSAEALFDVDPDQIVDHSFTKILARESHRSAMDYLSGISGPGVSSLMNDGREIIGKTAKGGLIPLFMTIGKLEKTDACCAVVRDITEWKKAEEELVTAKSVAENASAQKTEFLAKISHEIRTPLNAIIGFSDLMIEERFGKIDNDRYRGYLRDIHRSGNHVLELINDLLDISKIEAGKMDLEFDACDLNTTISETVALTQPEANKERIIIRTSLSAVVPKVVADPRSLRQIILNLVSNSIKYTKAGGQVIVSTVYEESGEVALRIRDTGIGMSELELAQAMKPFQQINAESNSTGTGLGLPLTKAMVEANRARFEIESEPDEGTLVEIHFPTQRVLADR